MTECKGVEISAVPVAEKIDNELLRRIQQITIDNGFQFDAVAPRFVERDSNGYDPQPRSIWIQREPATRNEDFSCPGNPAAIAWDRAYQIDGYARALDEDGRQIETINRGVSENQMIAAIQKAITNNDPAGWQTFGGVAMNAAILTDEEFDAPGYDGGRVGLVVTFRVDETDPFKIR